MRLVSIISLTFLIVFVVAQVVSGRSTKNTEEHGYTVLKKYKDFEVRKYKPALFSYTVMKSETYKSNSGTGFRRLAGYIFGGNENQQKIAMTSPVTMDMDDSVTMKFKIPEGMKLEDLPKPDNANVKFKAEPEKIVAAIQFGGWSTDEKIETYTNKLKSLLDENGIEYKGGFSYLGYNPPYEMANRRNEIVVEISL